jgi:ubiquinone/menaquinone biosynthesis C-methylase UbiE
MRLGVALIPELDTGWYFGQDINPETLAFGEEVLRQAGIDSDANHTLFSSVQFDLSAVDRLIDIAFSNSLFSHLNLNSILACLLQVRRVLAPRGVYYAPFFMVEPGRSWLDPYQDPHHYSRPLMEAVAKEAGFRMDLIRDFGHPTQAMARYRLR